MPETLVLLDLPALREMITEAASCPHCRQYCEDAETEYNAIPDVVLQIVIQALKTETDPLILNYSSNGQAPLDEKVTKKLIEVIRHKKKHIELNNALIELIGDYFDATGIPPSQVSAKELMQWSHQQQSKPS